MNWDHIGIYECIIVIIEKCKFILIVSMFILFKFIYIISKISFLKIILYIIIGIIVHSSTQIFKYHLALLLVCTLFYIS